jgi:hypothetical protein
MAERTDALTPLLSPSSGAPSRRATISAGCKNHDCQSLRWEGESQRGSVVGITGQSCLEQVAGKDQLEAARRREEEGEEEGSPEQVS